MDDGVSVIIPTYNRADLVTRAVRSAMAAAAPGDEIIVVDDGGKDDTPGAMKPLVDANPGVVRFVRIENRGVGGARNVGIRMSERPLVTFLDSDDQFAKDKLVLQRAVMKAHPELVYCFSNMYSTWPDGHVQHDLHSDWRPHVRIGSDSNVRLEN